MNESVKAGFPKDQGIRSNLNLELLLLVLSIPYGEPNECSQGAKSSNNI